MNQFTAFSQRTINRWRTYQSRLDNITIFFSSFKDQLVYIAMECLIGQGGELINVIPIIVLLVRPLAFASVL